MTQRRVTGLSDCTLFSLVVRGAAYLRGIHVLVWVSNVCPHVLPSNILLSSEYPYPQPFSSYILLPPTQIIGRFSFFRNIVFAIHLDICYVQIHSFYSLNSKLYDVLVFLDTLLLLCIQTQCISKCIANAMYLEKPKYLIIRYGWSKLVFITF